MDQPSIIAISDAAKDKGVHRTTIHRALERGELTAVPFGGRRAVARDEQYENWQPTETGRRIRNSSNS